MYATENIRSSEITEADLVKLLDKEEKVMRKMMKKIENIRAVWDRRKTWWRNYKTIMKMIK